MGTAPTRPTSPRSCSPHAADDRSGGDGDATDAQHVAATEQRVGLEIRRGWCRDGSRPHPSAGASAAASVLTSSSSRLVEPARSGDHCAVTRLDDEDRGDQRRTVGSLQLAEYVVVRCDGRGFESVRGFEHARRRRRRTRTAPRRRPGSTACGASRPSRPDSDAAYASWDSRMVASTARSLSSQPSVDKATS